MLSQVEVLKYDMGETVQNLLLLGKIEEVVSYLQATKHGRGNSATFTTRQHGIERGSCEVRLPGRKNPALFAHTYMSIILLHNQTLDPNPSVMSTGELLARLSSIVYMPVFRMQTPRSENTIGQYATRTNNVTATH